MYAVGWNTKFGCAETYYIQKPVLAVVNNQIDENPLK
jgi:hypothetical protein